MSDMEENTGKESEKKGSLRLKGFSYAVTAIMSALAILLCVNQLFHLKIAGFMPIGNAYYYYILTLYMSISFLIFSGGKRYTNKVPWFDWGLFIICIATTVYLG
ncbi:hypothetical protein KA005_13450, partial [bacterium]|nr:hypothetical protein [bacterium]